MKKFFLLLVLAVAGLTAGCNGSGYDPLLSGVVDTTNERMSRFNTGADLELRQAVDDFDYWLLIDRASTMSQWKVRSGFGY